MIKIERETTVTIDGADTEALANICEMTRRYIAGGRYHSSEFEEEQTQKIHKFLGTVFDNI